MNYASTGLLTGHERWLVNCARRGCFAKFEAGAKGKPVIRATVIRALLLGEIPLGLGSASSGMAGVRVCGASIEDKLDLADCAQPGTGLPTLVLQNCEFSETIDLSAARLARLSLAGSRLGFVNLRETNIDGPFDFSGASALGDADCWIDARGALIGGDLIGDGATLCVELPNETGAELTAGDRRRALWLAGATVHGSVRLAAGFAADGGVSLDTARVTGDIWIDGGLLAAEDGYALRAQNASLDGGMVVRHSTIHGIIWLLGLRTGGTLQISDTQIFGVAESDRGRLQERQSTVEEMDKQRQNANEPRDALIANDADIGASLRLTQDFVAYGRVSFDTAKIRGQIDATGARIHQPQPGRARAVAITNTQIGANLIFDDADVLGRIDLAGASIGGKLSLLGARLSNASGDGDSKALEAINLSVGGHAEFGRIESMDQPRFCKIEGAVDFTSARIGGNLAFTGAIIDNLTGNGNGCAIVARQVHVQASILLDENFHALGAVVLTGATIGRHLVCDTATLFNPEYSAIYAKDIEVGDDIKFLKSEVTGALRFERAMVAGSVEWHDLTVCMPDSPTGQPRRIARFEFVHAKIGSTLKCAGINFCCPCRIDLRGLRMATIDLVSATGWGRPHHNEEWCPVALDGMIYDRIILPDPPPQGAIDPERKTARVRLRKRAEIPTGCPCEWVLPAADRTTDQLLDWLLRDSINDIVELHGRHLVFIGSPYEPRRDGGASFNPQPFRQLTRVLRSQGNEDFARKIAIYEQWAVPSTNVVHSVLQSAYGSLFGFGLWPRRAGITLFFYILIGWLATIYVLEKGWLVETPQIAAASYHLGDDGKPEFVFMRADETGSPQHELNCSEITDQTLDAFVYAADVVLPFIPLHQESKCELRRELHKLRFCRALYTLFGWAFTSLALLTFSGIPRRFDGESG
jgi:hypothetical protein